MITFEAVKADPTIKTYIEKADSSLAAMGFTEHSFAHVAKVSKTASEILLTMGYSKRQAELAQIAGYLHDIGNVINRIDHAQSGAVMAFVILDRLDAGPADIATIINAIGNHDEGTASATDPITAALILADKSDVRRSRVRNVKAEEFDIHDRVNYSVIKSSLSINEGKTIITLNLEIDNEVCSVMDYFEIFLNRMTLCRKAAEELKLKFQLVINNQRLL